MDKSKIEKEILDLEKHYWQALIDKDFDAAISMTHFPCTITGAQGARVISEADYRQMLTSGDPSQYSGIDIRNPQAEVVNQDTVILTYSTQMNGTEMLDVSTWVKENGNWLCAFHSENPQV